MVVNKQNARVVIFDIIVFYWKMQKVKKDHKSCRKRLQNTIIMCYDDSKNTFGGSKYDKLEKQHWSLYGAKRD